MFDPPKHGAYACNVKVNNEYNQHLYCAVQCQKGYAYVSDQAYDYYLCAEGIWTGFTQPQRRPPHRFVDTSVRPWVDCTGKSISLHLSKDVNILLFYLYIDLQTCELRFCAISLEADHFRRVNVSQSQEVP